MGYLALVFDLCIAATLVGGHTDAVPGEVAVPVPIALDANLHEEVAALQFDIEFDHGVLAVSDVVIGAAAESASKELSFSFVSQEVVRVVVAGLNQFVIPDGVVANALFDVALDASSNRYTVDIVNVFSSDPDGVLVDTEAVPGSIEVVEGEGEGEGEGFPDFSGCYVASMSVSGAGLDELNTDVVCLTALVLILLGRKTGRHLRRRRAVEWLPQENPAGEQG